MGGGACGAEGMLNPVLGGATGGAGGAESRVITLRLVALSPA